MFEAPYAVALLAGMLAALNPCGFALLPAYLSLVVAQGGDGGSSRMAALGRAGRMSAGMTAGFVAVFAGFGVLVVPLALSVERYLPWATVVIGIGLIALGIALLAGHQLETRLPRIAGSAPGRTMRSVVGYGIAYAVASLSCTVGPFLALTTSTFRSNSPIAGAAVFVTYALGMGLVVTTLAVAVALARNSLVSRVRGLLPHVNRAGGALLLVAGAYVAYYGYYEIRVLSGGDTTDAVISAASAIQGRLAAAVSALGAGWIAVALVALIAIGVLGRRSRWTARGKSPIG